MAERRRRARRLRCASSAMSTTRELAALRAGAAIALVPSRSAETFGLAAAEAMAAGLPVAASRVGALPELVGEEGLVPPGDAGALARAIARLAGDRGRRRARAGAGSRPVRAGEGGGVPGLDLRRGDVSCGRVLQLQLPATRRPDHRHHRPGRLVPGGAAARTRATRVAAGWCAARATRRWAAPSICVARSSWCAAICSRREPCARRSSRSVQARSITWPRPRSCRPRGRSRSETLRAIAGSTAAILETVRELAPETRVFVAASGSMFGEATESPQREDTPCRPTTPYAIAKLAAHQLLRRAARPRRPARQLGDRLQPRVRAPAGAVRDAQDHARGGRDRARAAARS